MEKIGIICEYNPLHNGHIHHINEIKKKYPKSIIILVLNGYFLERGEISIISKYDKTALALNNNIDLVLELPTLFGTQSADTFAYTSIYYLNKLKVDRIIFGSESNDIEKIKKLVKESEKKEYNSKIKELLDLGTNYPTALAKAIKTKFSFLPNDLLAISYVKAINRINKKIIPETILRTNDYLDIESNDYIISASNIRNKIKNSKSINKYIPKEVKNKINKIDYDLYYSLLKTIILRNDNLNTILDVDEGIEYRLLEGAKKCFTFDSFIEYIKTKRYTYNKINRMLIHILLNIKKTDAKAKIEYLKVLGLNSKGKDYLNSIKKELDISVNPLKNSKIYEIELRASYIYELLSKKDVTKKELSNKPIIS